MGSVPAKMMAKVMGMSTDVSSVPGTKPINVYNTTAAMAATTIGINNEISIL
ncbi:hypothetical protein D3C76_1883030 [compost metagenome]